MTNIDNSVSLTPHLTSKLVQSPIECLKSVKYQLEKANEEISSLKNKLKRQETECIYDRYQSQSKYLDFENSQKSLEKLHKISPDLTILQENFGEIVFELKVHDRYFLYQNEQIAKFELMLHKHIHNMLLNLKRIPLRQKTKCRYNCLQYTALGPELYNYVHKGDFRSHQDIETSFNFVPFYQICHFGVRSINKWNFSECILSVENFQKALSDKNQDHFLRFTIYTHDPYNDEILKIVQQYIWRKQSHYFRMHDIKQVLYCKKFRDGLFAQKIGQKRPREQSHVLIQSVQPLKKQKLLSESEREKENIIPPATKEVKAISPAPIIIAKERVNVVQQILNKNFNEFTDPYTLKKHTRQDSKIETQSENKIQNSKDSTQDSNQILPNQISISTPKNIIENKEKSPEVSQKIDSDMKEVESLVKVLDVKIIAAPSIDLLSGPPPARVALLECEEDEIESAENHIIPLEDSIDLDTKSNSDNNHPQLVSNETFLDLFPDAKIIDYFRSDQYRLVLDCIDEQL